MSGWLRFFFFVSGWLLLGIVWWRGNAPSSTKEESTALVAAPVSVTAEKAKPPVIQKLPEAPAKPAEAPVAASETVRDQVQSLLEGLKPEAAVKLLEADRTMKEEERAAKLAQLYLQLNQPEKAIAVLEPSLRARPDQPQALVDLVSAYDSPERHERGQEFLRDLQSRKPDAPGPALAYADMMARSGQGSAAADYLLKKAPTLSDPAEALTVAGSMLAREGKAAQATPHLEQAVQMREKRLAESGDMPSAATQALRGSRLELVQALVSQKRFDEADQQLRSLESLGPEDRAFAERARADLAKHKAQPQGS